MKIAQTFTALILSMMLMWTQAVLAVSTPVACKSVHCTCKCVCKNCHRACCAARSNSNSAPIPATPARSVSYTDAQLAATPVRELFCAPAISLPRGFSIRASAMSVSAVPLYQRGCLFLI